MSATKLLRISCNQPANTVVYFPYPWAGNAGNTQDRLQRIADALGWDIVAGHAPGTGTLRTPQHVRTVLHTDDYGLLSDLSISHANDVRSAILKKGHHYERCIGWGDSGRSWLIAMMALHTDLFTDVLTRDGAILNRLNVMRGALLLLRNGGKRFDDPSTPSSEIVVLNRGVSRRAYEVAVAATEMGTYRDIMCTTDITAQALRDLAAKSSIPFCNVLLGNGISGSAVEVQAFNAELATLRGQRAHFMGVYEPRLGHGNLQDWRIALRHLQLL
jgi:hypothetical protein